MFNNDDYHNEDSSYFSNQLNIYSIDSEILKVLDNTPSIRGGSMLDHINDTVSYDNGLLGGWFSANNNDGNSSDGFFSGGFSSWFSNATSNINPSREIVSAPFPHTIDDSHKKCGPMDYLSAAKDGCIDKITDKETIKDIGASTISGATIGGLLGGSKGARIGASVDAGKTIVKACAKGSYDEVIKKCGNDESSSSDSGGFCIIL